VAVGGYAWAVVASFSALGTCGVRPSAGAHCMLPFASLGGKELHRSIALLQIARPRLGLKNAQEIPLRAKEICRAIPEQRVAYALCCVRRVSIAKSTSKIFLFWECPLWVTIIFSPLVASASNRRRGCAQEARSVLI